MKHLGEFYDKITNDIGIMLRHDFETNFHISPLRMANVEVTGAARLYRSAPVWTAGLGY
jgi:hypothetical protein